MAISALGSTHLTRVLTILLFISQLWVWCSPVLPTHYRAQAHFCLKLAALDHHHHERESHTLQQCMVCVLHHTIASDEPTPNFVAVWEITHLGRNTQIGLPVFDVHSIDFRWPQAHAPPLLSLI